MKYNDYNNKIILEPGSHFIEVQFACSITNKNINDQTNSGNIKMPYGYDLLEIISVEVEQQKDKEHVIAYIDCLLQNTEYVCINTEKRDLGRPALEKEIQQVQNSDDYKKRIRTLS